MDSSSAVEPKKWVAVDSQQQLTARVESPAAAASSHFTPVRRHSTIRTPNSVVAGAKCTEANVDAQGSAGNVMSVAGSAMTPVRRTSTLGDAPIPGTPASAAVPSSTVDHTPTSTVHSFRTQHTVASSGERLTLGKVYLLAQLQIVPCNHESKISAAETVQFVFFKGNQSI